MSFLDEMASYLDTQAVGSYNGTNAARTIFVGILPGSPDDCLSLLGLPNSSIGPARDVPALHFPRFQIIVRSTDYETGATKLEAVRTALHGLIGYQLTSYYVMRCHADQEGGPIGQDDQGRYEFSINFSAEYYAHTA